MADGTGVERFKAFLVDRGLKYTKQRRTIAEVFFEAEDHPSLVELLERVKARQSNVGYATVYRTMKLMAESGLAIEHKFSEDHARFEPSTDGEHHDHLICVDCGRIIEYEDHEIERLQEAVAKRHGFEMVDHKHEIYGRCVTVDCEHRPAAEHAAG